MGLLKKLRNKLSKPKDDKDPSLTPTASGSAAPSLIDNQASTSIAASHTTRENKDTGNAELAARDAPTTQSAADQQQQAAKDSSLPPTASAEPGLIQASTNIAASHAVKEDKEVGEAEAATTEAPTTQPAADQHQQPASGSMRGSKRDRWLARAALILDLTKSAADAAGLAPLKGACEGMVTLLGSIQVCSRYFQSMTC